MSDIKYTSLATVLDLEDKNAVIEWLTEHNINIDGSTGVPQWKCDYINRIFIGGYIRLSNFQVGLSLRTRSGGENGEYTLSRPAGQIDHIDFTPSLTPDQMLRLGSFGGKYLNALHREIPIEWLLVALAEDKIRPYAPVPDPNVNYYKVLSGQSLSEWRSKGWIRDVDPLGWFQWYTRYYLGRRCPDDLRQISRWKAFKRHLGQIRAHPDQNRFVQKQALIQWAYPVL
jgi:hypothetical protein